MLCGRTLRFYDENVASDLESHLDSCLAQDLQQDKAHGDPSGPLEAHNESRQGL